MLPPPPPPTPFYIFFPSAGNVLMISLWSKEDQMFMQLLHFCFAFGAITSPLVSAPFLAPKITPNETLESTTFAPFSRPSTPTLDFSILSKYDTDGTVTLGPLYNTTTTFFLSNTKSTSELPRETQVKYAYLIGSVFAFLVSLPFLWFYFKDRSNGSASAKQPETKSKQRNLPIFWLLVTFLLTNFFFLIYAIAEFTFAMYLMAFLVEQYEHVTKTQGASGSAVFYASLAAGRFSMVFVGKFISPGKIVAFLSLLLGASAASFYVSAITFENTSALMVLSGFVGFSMSGIYPSALVWTESEMLRVNSYVASALQLFGGLACMLQPLVLGFLMEHRSNLWFVYLTTGESVLVGFIFGLMVLYARFYLNKRFGGSWQQADKTDEQ